MAARPPALLFAIGERVILEHGERSKRAKLTGATGVVVDGAAKRGWLRVRVGDAALNWHQRHLRRVVTDVNLFERLTPDLLVLVLDRVGCHRSLAAAAHTCRDGRVACRQPSPWHTVDFVVAKNALAYALHLIDVRARLRSLRVTYSRGRHEDANVVAWLLRECDTSGLERARVTASMWPVFAHCSLDHLEALSAMPSLSAERRARVSKLIDGFYAVVDNARPEPVVNVLAAVGNGIIDECCVYIHRKVYIHKIERSARRIVGRVPSSSTSHLCSHIRSRT
jgi:hypothetical protein